MQILVKSKTYYLGNYYIDWFLWITCIELFQHGLLLTLYLGTNRIALISKIRYVVCTSKLTCISFHYYHRHEPLYRHAVSRLYYVNNIMINSQFDGTKNYFLVAVFIKILADKIDILERTDRHLLIRYLVEGKYLSSFFIIFKLQLYFFVNLIALL